MEPQFSGIYDPWGLQEEIRLLKVAQFEHAERLSQHSERISKLEKRNDDSRIRSLWSSPSPFPAPLSTFSQRMQLFILSFGFQLTNGTGYLLLTLINRADQH
jgi:hypothetical protein